MSQTRIKSEIDFEHQGKQTGFLRLAHSVNRSAYGSILIPIVVVKNGEGPTALLISGSHGDEYEGQVATCNAARLLDSAMVQGRVIILPAANYAAVMEGTRVSPIDGGNLNRLYPGDPHGTVTQQIAYYIEHELLPMADVVLDLHSGGTSLTYVPSVIVRRSVRPELFEKGVEIVKALGVPLAYVPRDAQGGDVAITGAARRQKVLNLGTELGGGGHLQPAALQIAEQAIRNMLVHMTILDRSQYIEPKQKTRLMEVGGADYFVYAAADGIFEPLVELGDMVSKGQQAARIHFPEDPWRKPETVQFGHNGFVLCKRTIGRTVRGDCLFHLGTDAEF